MELMCAPELASKLPATRPHNTTRCTVSLRSHPPAEQRGYEVARGKVVGCEWLARQWHARGQGFKSPQLHQAQPISSLRSERHLPEICRKTRPVAARTLSALSGAGGRRGPAQRP